MDFEFAILDFIAKLHTDFGDWFLPFVSSFGNGGIGWIILAIMLSFIPRYRKAGLTVGLALIFCLLIGTLTLKPFIARMRPYTYFPEMTLLIPPLNDFSFPSGHTFASFAAATALFLRHRLLGCTAFLLAVTIAFSRLYMYVHFPSDVLAGAILGIASGWIAYKIINWYNQKYQPNWLQEKNK